MICSDKSKNIEFKQIISHMDQNNEGSLVNFNENDILI